MKEKVNQLLKGKSFEELVTIYEGFIKESFDTEIEFLIMSAMEKADTERFIAWAEAC